jgi:hypothetical protein
MTPTNANPPVSGLFEHLVSRQLPPTAKETSRGLRPRLPYLFEERLAVDDSLEFAEQQEVGLSRPSPSYVSKNVEDEQPTMHLAEKTHVAPLLPPRQRPAATDEPKGSPSSFFSRSAGPGPGELPRSDRAVGSAPHLASSLVQQALPSRQLVEPRVSHVHPLERIVQVYMNAEKSAIDSPVRAVRPTSRVAEVDAVSGREARSAVAAPFHIAPVRQRADDTVIEIHIGRLEVRAPAAPAKSAPQQPTPSDNRLAGYLRSRANGARS